MIPAPGHRTPRLKTPLPNAPRTESVEFRGEGPPDTCLADGIDRSAVRVPSEVHDAREGNVRGCGPALTPGGDPEREGGDGEPFDADPAGVVGWAGLGGGVRVCFLATLLGVGPGVVAFAAAGLGMGFGDFGGYRRVREGEGGGVGAEDAGGGGCWLGGDGT